MTSTMELDRKKLKLKSERKKSNEAYRKKQKEKREQELSRIEAQGDKTYLLYNDERDEYKYATGEAELRTKINEMIGYADGSVKIFTLIEKVTAERVIARKKIG